MTWSDARATWQLLGEHERKALAYLATYRGHVVTPSELSRHLGTSWQKAAVTAGELRKLGLVRLKRREVGKQFGGPGMLAVHDRRASLQIGKRRIAARCVRRGCGGK